MSDSPLTAYRTLLAEGVLQPDAAQQRAVEKLHSLHEALVAGKTAWNRRNWPKWLNLKGKGKAAPPRGLYIYGGVGRGKSMLMDVFFGAAPLSRKRRVHFHAFMIEVHDTVHALRRKQKTLSDPLSKVAQGIAATTRLLCFDEFHVSNIADAMILGRLFEALFEAGVVVVATSNWPPDDLYKDGLKRQNFLPFIALLKQRMDVLHLESATDYRTLHPSTEESYHTPLGAATATRLHMVFEELAAGQPVAPARLSVKGRTLSFPQAAGSIVLTDFTTLCGAPLGPEDYLRLAERFSILLLDGVPQLDDNLRNEARRFMTLIDTLYEQRRRLIMAAAVPLDQLYQGRTLWFEFQRTLSRLAEMQTAGYRTS